MVALSLLSSLLFVMFNAFSIWMVSTLISTIMTPDRSVPPNVLSTASLHEKMEGLAYQLIGSGSQLEQLKMLCLILVVSYVMKNVFFYINNVSLSYVQNRMIMDIRNQLFSHLQNLPLSFFKKSKSGELSSIIMNDVSSMRVAFTQSIQSLINEPISIFVLLGMLFIISSKLTLYAIITVPLSALIITKLGQSIRRKAMRSSLSIAGIMNILQETLSGIRVVKAFAMEKFEVKRFMSETKKYFSLTFKQENLRNLSTPINDLIGVSLGVILLWIGANEVIVHGNLTPDGFIRFIIYLFAMLQPARKLGNVNAQIQGGLASAERVFSIIDIESNITNPIHPVEIQEFTNHIKFNNVSFQYENSENLILSSININIHRGEVLALVGSSGAGKSTFADLIPRFYDVSSGEIIIDGIDIRKLTVENLRSLMGIVSQDTILFNDTVAHNISYGLPEAGIDEIRQAAKTANALEFIDNLPNGFDTIIGEKGTRLSGGQRQRISIARALLKNPDILILDEATSALDTESERKVQEAIDTLVQNRTVIVIAHRLSTITKADQIIVLDEGEIVESGTHEKLLEINGKYKHLYNIQFGGSGK
ncbi:MAG: ABC transporter ATP-binding protein [Candidatus Marinimicrobia bacterium]|nr:ABC transporter ATP-binding protein [Candidatus Neomarinimicrobiota bacterium]